jgi:hypothetical protein
LIVPESRAKKEEQIKRPDNLSAENDIPGRSVYLHGSFSIASAKALDLSIVESHLFRLGYSVDPTLEVKQLSLSYSLFIDIVSQISVDKDWASFNLGLIEVNIVLEDFAYGDRIIEVDDDHMGGLFKENEVVIEDSL